MNENFETVGTGQIPVNFTKAVEALNEGKIVKRSNWRINTFIFKQNPAIIPNEVIPKMSSLPDSVKDIFAWRRKEFGAGGIRYNNQICIVDANNDITSYNFSNEDIYSKDWIILE